MKNPVLQYGEYTFVYFIEEQHVKMFMGGVQMRPTNWVPADAFSVVSKWLTMLEHVSSSSDENEEMSPIRPAKNKEKKDTAGIISFPGRKKK